MNFLIITTTRSHPASIGTYGGSNYNVVMFFIGDYFLAAGIRPYMTICGSRANSRHQITPIRTKGQTTNLCALISQGFNKLPRYSIPEANSVIITSRSYSAINWRYCY
ncbi:hypothetical protein THIOM_002557 [Candidatus Thiomargarita nelsonii]|uniref:Uncharacterized protein n=1 Tax=Candidatus Thiomargarita nelsonii TaxID=1003181 RepID=A0A176S157_9GAMM|nr:hypothetical protein THIOM_002557 [Candidatus Thiomargarita nelsonii]